MNKYEQELMRSVGCCIKIIHYTTSPVDKNNSWTIPLICQRTIFWSTDVLTNSPLDQTSVDQSSSWPNVRWPNVHLTKRPFTNSPWSTVLWPNVIYRTICPAFDGKFQRPWEEKKNIFLRAKYGLIVLNIYGFTYTASAALKNRYSWK